MVQRQYLMPTHITIFVLLIVLLIFPTNSNAQIGTWVRLADMPNARNGCVAEVINGKIYVTGGGPTSLFDDSVDEYDPQTNTWTTKASIDKNKWYASSAVANGKLYVFGGFFNGSYSSSFVEEYDPLTDKWATKAPMPTGNKEMWSCTIDSKIYVFGGWGSQGELGTVLVYDPEADTWTKKNDMPMTRSDFAGGLVNGKVYLIGGWGYQVSSHRVLVQEYDPVTDSWVKKADMPTGRELLSASVVDSKIYVMGGTKYYGSDAGISVNSVSTVEIYDPLTDIWTKYQDMPAPRVTFASVEINEKIYIFGGVNQSGNISSVYMYDTGFGMKIKDISLQEGFVTGGETITIFGSGFLPNMIVTIGDKPLSDLKITDTIITGIVPPNLEGEYDINFIVKEANYSGVAGKFFYKPVSNITVAKINPNSGKQAGGDIASITGSGFLPGATVMLDSNLGTDVSVTSTLITFRIPSGTEGTKDMVVTNPDGQKGILRNAYTYNPFPIIDKILSSSATIISGGPLNGGTEVTIKGQNFMQNIAIYIGSDRISKIDFFSSTELRFLTPPATEEGIKPIRVVNPDGQETVFKDGFSYNHSPNIYEVEPNAGALEGGTWVTIKGAYFYVFIVYVGGIPANIQYQSSDSITIIIPPSSAGAKDIKVENSDGQTDTLEKAFTYNPAPAITGITPNNGKLSGGIKINIQGNGFMPEAKVFIGILGQNTLTTIPIWSWEYVSSTMMTALLPSSKESKIVSIIVVNPDDQKAILKDGFMYNSIPTIISVQPDNGPSSGGTTLVIKGSGFLPGAKVQVGYGLVSAIVKDDSTIEAITPSGQPGKFSVGVINPDTQSVFRSDSFIYIGKMAYNYPNPFRASQGTTFRYVSKDKVSSIEVRIFNTGGVPIDIVQADGTNEVKWRNPSLQTGIYIYLMEVVLDDGKKENYKGVLEVSR